MTRRSSPAVFLSKDLQDYLAGVTDEDKIKKWVEDMTDVLKENMYSGDIIGKKLIPNYYFALYGVNNLYHYLNAIYITHSSIKTYKSGIMFRYRGLPTSMHPNLNIL